MSVQRSALLCRGQSAGSGGNLRRRNEESQNSLEWSRLRAHRDYAAARRFFERAIELHGVPDKIAIDKSGANTAAIVGMLADSGADIEMRQSKYLNNIVEQDQRAIKRVVRPMMGFKAFRCARIILAGIETMHMIKKGQLECSDSQASSAAEQFYSLAF